MAAPKRPRTLTVLLVFLLWVDGKTLGSLVFPKTSDSYHFFAAIDAVWIHFVLGAVTVALAVTATGYLWKASAGCAVGRESRGLPVTPERLDRMFTPQGMYMAAGFMLLILAILSAAAWRRRNYEAA